MVLDLLKAFVPGYATGDSDTAAAATVTGSTDDSAVDSESTATAATGSASEQAAGSKVGCAVPVEILVALIGEPYPNPISQWKQRTIDAFGDYMRCPIPPSFSKL